MTTTENHSWRETSRRRLLHDALRVTGGVVLGAAGVVLAGEAAAANKTSQNAAGYKATPMGKAQCDNCGVWQAPASCKLVDGPISPSGWCNLYNAKS